MLQDRMGKPTFTEFKIIKIENAYIVQLEDHSRAIDARRWAFHTIDNLSAFIRDVMGEFHEDKLRSK